MSVCVFVKLMVTSYNWTIVDIDEHSLNVCDILYESLWSEPYLVQFDGAPGFLWQWVPSALLKWCNPRQVLVVLYIVLG